MLTSFFGKSNPVNYILVCLGIMLGYFTWVFWSQGASFQPQYYFIRALLILLSVFLILLLDFIIRKNKLTTINTYAILIFGCMLLMIPHHISNGNTVLANLFLLLAFRRIFSIQSNKNLNKKILDSSIWITVASLFSFWSLLFFIVLFASIVLKKTNKSYRYFLIPLAGLLMVLILVSTYKAFYNQEVFWFLHLKPSYSLDISSYERGGLLLLSVFMSLAVLLVIFKGITKYPKLAKKNKPNHILLLLILILGTALSLMAIDKNGTEFFYLLFPLSILLTKAIETIRSQWIKELILWLFLIVPGVLFVMN